MGESDETWTEVGDQLKTLGLMFKHHYQTYEGENLTGVVSEDDVRDAMRTLGESVKTAFGAIGEAIADAEIRDEARQTAGSFLDALGATFSELGADISKRREIDDLPSRPTAEDPTSPPSSDGEE